MTVITISFVDLSKYSNDNEVIPFDFIISIIIENAIFCNTKFYEKDKDFVFLSCLGQNQTSELLGLHSHV